MTENRQVLLRERPVGIPRPDQFEIVSTAMPVVGPGQVLVRNAYLSVDPAMRGWVNDVPNYLPPVALGAVMRSFAVGRVERSEHRGFKPGDVVTGLFGWQEWASVPGSVIERIVDDGLPISTALGVLGLNGVTAYFGLLEVGEPRPGDTVVVSTAAGSVGSAVGQIGKIAGCRTVGIAGGAAKVAQCLEVFGFDAAVDYRAGDFMAQLAAACPDGVDVYFDNTAGAVSDAVMRLLAPRARVVVCGTASVPDWSTVPLGPRVERTVLVKRARIQAILAFDYAARYPEAQKRLAAWVRGGRLRYVEDVLDGIEHAPGAIEGLYAGQNMGKRLIRVGPE
jgi:NADPH-dependent curcumin reductase CurA